MKRTKWLLSLFMAIGLFASVYGINQGVSVSTFTLRSLRAGSNVTVTGTATDPIVSASTAPTTNPQVGIDTATLQAVSATKAEVLASSVTLAVMASTAGAMADRNKAEINSIHLSTPTYATKAEVFASTTALLADNAVWYTTTTIYVQFTSTDVSGDLCISTATIPLDTDYTIIGWEMKGDVSDTANVFISSAAFGYAFKAISGTDYPDLFAQTDSSDTALTGWRTSLGVGGWVRIVLRTAIAARNITVGLRVKKWAK